MRKDIVLTVWYALFALLSVFWLREAWLATQRIEQIPYSELLQELQQGDIEEVRILADRVQGRFKTPRASGAREFVAVRVDPALARDLERYGVKFSGAIESTWFRDLLSWVLPTALFVGVWFFVLRRFIGRQFGESGLLTVGKSKARVYAETSTKVTFADVAGVDEAKAELQELVGFLRDPSSHGRLGARIPKGVLLVGPPGTGKTLLARAVAGEAGVPFYSISGSEFVEMFVGVGAARVRDLFTEAQKHAPAIVFIDELDALGRARGGYAWGGHDEKEQTLNQLLAELDGFDPRKGLVLLAATNRPEILDPALLRPGRFDRQVLVDRPDKRGRAQILQVHLAKIRVAADIDIDKLASLTPGFTGADLANLVNEAALVATRRSAVAVELPDFTVAVERIVAGLEKRNRLLNAVERRIVAFHEMGHALVGLSLPGTDRIHKVSIIPRGVSALGHTIQRPTEDRFLMTRDELENKMAVLLGGRAAELLMFAELSTGAADDLAKATEIARAMVARYGMSERLGSVAYDKERSTFLDLPPGMTPRGDFSQETAREIDCALRELVDSALQKALEILRARKAELTRGAQMLLDKETLLEDELSALLTQPSSDRIALPQT
jgi:cell division protease FtsH